MEQCVAPRRDEESNAPEQSTQPLIPEAGTYLSNFEYVLLLDVSFDASSH